MPDIETILDFKFPFFVCTLIGLILGYLGTHVLRREVIFIDIALAQFAAVGATLAHFVFEKHEHSHGADESATLEYLCAFGMVIFAAFFYAFVRKKVTQISLEAVIGVTYAIAFAATLFIPGVTGGGHMHMQEMLIGVLYYAGWPQVETFLYLFGGVALVSWVFRKPLNEISDNYQQAQDQGRNVLLWDVLFYTIMGIVITLSVKIIGVVMVFAYLVIPVTIAALFSRRLIVQLPIIAGAVVVSSAMGLMFSCFERTADFSVGPPIGVCLGLILVIAALSKKLSRSPIKA
jgi:zinc/manganese transport system permease protein